MNTHECHYPFNLILRWPFSLDIIINLVHTFTSYKVRKPAGLAFFLLLPFFFIFLFIFWEWTDMTNSSGSQVGAFYTLVAPLKQRSDKQLPVLFSFLALAHYLSTILISKQNRQIMLKLENFLLKDADILVIHTNQHINITYHVHKYHK